MGQGLVALFRSNLISSSILFLVIATAPLPYGSRDSFTVAVWCFVLGFGLIFASPKQLRGGHLALLAGIAFVVACYGFVLHEQLAEHPWIAAPNPIWAKVSEVLGKPIPPSVSVIRGEPFYAIGPSLAAILALTLGIVVGADKQHADRALQVMAWSGVAYAVYGLFAIAFGRGALTATFINRNTAATYFGSCAIVWLVLLMETIRMRLPAGAINWSEAIEHLLAEGRRQRELIARLCMFFVCLTAMFLTVSRGGVLFSLFAMAVVVVVFFRRDLPRGKGLVILIAGAGALALVLLQFLGGQVEGRIDAQGLADAGRAAAFRSNWRIIADHPWFGTGLGTFEAIFPAYRSSDISIVGIWDKAHSTPLELAIELGIPMTLVIAAAWFVALVVLGRGTRRSRRETVVPLAALGVCLIALLHTSIDFSMQVPGYAIVIFALTGIGLAQSFHVDQKTTDRRHRRRSESQETKEMQLSSEV